VVVLKQLGYASVIRSGVVVAGRAARGSRLALLAILAAARGRPFTRDRIIALLWPESPNDRARHQLSDTLYILRGALGDDVIRGTGDELTLNLDTVSADVTEFEQLMEAGEWQRAVELYAGPLLDGCHPSDSAEFEDWLQSERMRLGQLYTRALNELGSRAEEAGDHAAAVGWWRKLAAHEPHSDRVALGLMRSLEATGDRAGALRHARTYAALLEQEFEAQPDGDVVAFAERLRRAPAPRPERPPLAGVQGAVPNLKGGVRAASSGSAVRPRRRRLHSALAAAAAAVMIVGAVYGVTVWQGDGEAGSAVAVMPFVNMSAESGTDYFSDGLTEQIISVLSRIPGLRVAARTSSFALRDEKLDIRTIADTLNVSAVLEGSVRRDGSRLRVTAQLIDARTGHHIWSHHYDREIEQVVEVQDEIARDIARALALRLPGGGTRPARRHSPDPQAYDLYLRALYLRDTFTPEALREARTYLDRAVELDRNFARAYALKATVLGPTIFWRYAPLEPTLAEARDAVARALELDPTVSEAHGALGMIKLFFDHDFPAAERALLRALELNANDHHAWHMLANYYSAMGRADDAAAARARGADIDPLNPRIGFMLAYAYAEANRFPEALAQYSRMLKLQATHPIALGLSTQVPAGPSQVYLRQGRYHEAVEDYVRIATLRGASTSDVDSLRAAFRHGGLPSFWRSWLAFDLRQSGNRTDAVVWRHTTRWPATRRRPSPGWTAPTQSATPGCFVHADPTFAAVREHPRFRRIFQEMNFTSN
jgi:TolB-like protein/DNA-binding SARP family transcriptional activator